jgi:hypothetical protein
MSSAVSVPDALEIIPPTSANVILIGEVHSHDLGSALTTTMSLFLKENKIKYRGYDISIYREQAYDSETTYTFDGKTVTTHVYPLEENAEFEINREDVYDSVMNESLPSVITEVYYILKNLSKLIYLFSTGQTDFSKDSSVSMSKSEGPTVSQLQSVFTEIFEMYSDVICNLNHPESPLFEFRQRMMQLFPNPESLRNSIQRYQSKESKDKFIILYQLMYDYFKSLISSSKHAGFTFNDRPVTIMGVTVQQIDPSIENEQKSMELIMSLQSERDKSMVEKLRSSIFESIKEGKNPKRINIVVVGNNHLDNMRKLLSVPPFEIVFENNTPTLEKTVEKGVLVKIKNLQNKPELNGRFGIVVGNGTTSKEITRYPIFVSGTNIDAVPLGLKSDNFEVVLDTVSPKLIDSIFGKDADKVKKITSGGSKRYKKCSKRRCYSRTRKGKRSKRRSAKKY